MPTTSRGLAPLPPDLHHSHSPACPRELLPLRGHPVGWGGRSPPHPCGAGGSQGPQHRGLQNRAPFHKDGAPSLCPLLWAGNLCSLATEPGTGRRAAPQKPPGWVRAVVLEGCCRCSIAGGGGWRSPAIFDSRCIPKILVKCNIKL